jgi:hypothetical protein
LRVHRLEVMHRLMQNSISIAQVRHTRTGRDGVLALLRKGSPLAP